MVHPPGGGRGERLSKHPALDSRSIRECTGENLLRHTVPRSGSVDGRTARCRGEASQRNWGRHHDTSRRARRTQRPSLRAVPCRLQDRSADNRGAPPPPRLDGFASPLRSGRRRSSPGSLVPLPFQETCAPADFETCRRARPSARTTSLSFNSPVHETTDSVLPPTAFRLYVASPSRRSIHREK